MRGRFSAALFDPLAEEAVAANSVVRVDPLFRAASNDYSVVGTEARAVAAAVGELRYSSSGLFTLINTGFFGTNDTAFDGVRCLPSSSTWLVRGDTETCSRRSLGDLKRGDLRAPPDPADVLAEELVGSMGEMYCDAGPLLLGLTGGKDSRLLAAAARRANLAITTQTLAQGDWNAADVYVAKLVADRMGLPHVVNTVATESDEQTITVDYLSRAATNLHSSDGAIYAYEIIGAIDDPFLENGQMSGLGGELLRGGYAEKHKKLTPERAREIASAQFARSARFFLPDVSRAYEDFADSWFAELGELGPWDTLDCLYADFRCGRWIAATSRSSMIRSFHRLPFLDNRLAQATLALPATSKVTGELLSRILARLSPEVADVPLANALWPGTPKQDAERLKRDHPQAFESMKRRAATNDWRRAFPAELVAHIRDYCLEDGRIELLRDVLDLEACAEFLRGDRDQLRKQMKFVHGLFSACTLVSGDWLKAPRVSAPLEIDLSH